MNKMTNEEMNLHEVSQVTVMLTDDDKQFRRAFGDVKDAICEFRPVVGDKPVVCRVIFYSED